MQDYQNIENSVIPYSQPEIEKVLKQMLFDRGVTDVLYSGSNVSQLSSVISYVISSLNVNTAINLQETLLPLATKRMNILFGARQLGYEARPRVSYSYDLLLRAELNEAHTMIDLDGNQIIDTKSNQIFDLDLVHNTEFTCGAYTYYYTGPTIRSFWNEITNAEITYLETTSPQESGYSDVYDKVYKHIKVKEGKLYNYANDPVLSVNAETYQDSDGITRVKQDYLVPFKNVEEHGITVYLTYIDEYGEIREHEIANQTDQYLIDENMNQEDNLYARAENIILGFPSIFFQMGGFGKALRKGTLLEIEVLTSSGKDGEAIGRFEVDEDQFTTGFEVFEYSLVQKGLSEESSESIKENAMVYHNTANRAVTKYDFVAITKRHSIVKEATAWGGEEEKPKEKGHIWISGIPQGQEKLIKFRRDVDISKYEVKIGEPNSDAVEVPFSDYPNIDNWMLTDSFYTDEEYIKGQQEELTAHLDNYKMMTTEVHYRHPLYVDFDIDCDIVKYDVSKNTESINNGVFGEILNYFENYLEKFDSEYINSNLQRIIDRYLGFNSGITYNISVYGSLCRKMVDTFNQNLSELETYECPARTNRNVIKVSLAFPFESVFDMTMAVSVLKPDLLPRIDTLMFDGNNNLTVDYDGFDTGPNVNTNYMSTDMFLGGEYFGEYAVNRTTNSIDLTFVFTDTGITSLNNVFGEGTSADKNYVNFNIDYPNSVDTSTNIPFTKNAIPRLRNVTFLDN
ncbi:MAG: hypothetical protein J7L15_07325 [Clostridiales bacterium]|nr:hypothetical protein [Clostridiales bacterium]